MIRPWYRSRLFWLGIPGLAFLVWCWLALDQRNAGIAWTTPEYRWGLSDSEGFVQLAIIKGSGLTDGYPSGLSFWSRVFSRANVLWFPKAFQHVHPLPGNKITTEYIRVSYWLLILLYLATWLGALTGWQRRKARLSRRAAEAGSGEP